MGNRTLNGTINLKALKHAMYTTTQGTECIMIPIKDNLLEIEKGSNFDKIDIPVRIVIYDQQNDKGQDGLISKAIGSGEYKAASEEQKELWKDYSNADTKAATPILGNVKDWGSNSGSGNNAASADVHQAPGKGEPDDLPF